MVEAERMVGRSTMTFAILARFRAISKDGTPRDFAAFMRSELPKWAELVKLAGATAE